MPAFALVPTGSASGPTVVGPSRRSGAPIAARGETVASAIAGNPFAGPHVAAASAEGAAEVYGEPLGTRVHVVERGGHLAAEDGYGPWPAVERWALHGSFGPAPVAALV